ncbi:unnamed protein product [Malus baccata var. baccata]
MAKRYSPLLPPGWVWIQHKGSDLHKTDATLGATASFFLGRTTVLLLRLAPLLPFNMMNYLISMTPVNVGNYVLASWLRMMVLLLFIENYSIGSCLGALIRWSCSEDVSDITDGWNEVSTTHWYPLVVAGVCILSPSTLPIVADSSLDLQKPLIVRIDSEPAR